MGNQKNSSKGNLCVGNRHPTEKKCRKPTVRPSYISFGKRDRALLRYLYDSPTDRFNVRAYSRSTGINRSTVYDMIARLEDKGLVERVSYGCRMISLKGKAVMESQESVGKPSRRECRKAETLSTHYSKYKMTITDRSAFTESFIKELKPADWQINKLPNLIQYFIYFHDATITINPKKVIINIHDILTEDIEKAHFELFRTALGYVEKLRKIGVKGEGLILEPAHYARVLSTLSDALEKIDKRYYLDLGEGFKFWIDHSNDKREDETNHEVLRERLDDFITDLSNSDSLFSDVDKVKEVLGTIAKIEALRHMPIENGTLPKGRPDYFG